MVLTLSPIAPYQLFERVNAYVVRVHVVDGDIALLEISFVNLVGVPCTGCEQ